jgi:hypothetical protein
MMFVEAVIVGLLVGFFRGGRFDNFNYLEIRLWYVSIVGLLLQLMPVFITGYDFLAYIKLRGVWLVMLGGMLNLLAVLLNNFKMPVNLIFNQGTRLNSFMDTIVEGDIINYVLSADGGWLSALGKILITPNWYPFPHLLSAGDILITVGVFVFVYGEMMRKQFKRKSTMVRYTYKSRV